MERGELVLGLLPGQDGHAERAEFFGYVSKLAQHPIKLAFELSVLAAQLIALGNRGGELFLRA